MLMLVIIFRLNRLGLLISVYATGQSETQKPYAVLIVKEMKVTYNEFFVISTSFIYLQYSGYKKQFNMQEDNVFYQQLSALFCKSRQYDICTS